MFVRHAVHYLVLVAILSVSSTSVLAEALPVQTIEFEAKSVERTMKYNLILPKGYEESDKRYPVLYLLHGFTSNYRLWAIMGVPEYASRYEMIIVMPDVGNSWYVNWAQSDDGQKNDWEDYMVNDVIGHVDSHYRTISKREGRAINGLSMGGYGALIIGLRHPELFCSIASHSGALEYTSRHRKQIESGAEPERKRTLSTRPAKVIDIEGFNSQAERTPKGKIFLTAEDCDAYDPFKLVLKVPKDQLPHIQIDCGTEDRLISSSRAFQKLLIENTIPFSYAESGGGHWPVYWKREVDHSMAIQYNVIVQSLRAIEQESN